MDRKADINSSVLLVAPPSPGLVIINIIGAFFIKLTALNCIRRARRRDFYIDGACASLPICYDAAVACGLLVGSLRFQFGRRAFQGPKSLRYSIGAVQSMLLDIVLHYGVQRS